MNTNQKIKELIKDWKNQIDMNGNREYRQAYQNCIIALETLLEPCKHENKTCEWVLDEDNFEYDTECCQQYYASELTLKEQEFNHCIYCGGKIEEVHKI